MNIRPATPGDLGFCHMCARHFIASTRYTLQYDAEKSQRSFWTYITDPNRTLLIAEEGATPIGGVMLACSYEFTVQPFCYLIKLFVLPEARGSAASRLLLSSTEDWARQMNCSHVFANAGAAISRDLDTIAGNLYRRVGFSDAGDAFVLPLSQTQEERKT